MSANSSFPLVSIIMPTYNRAGLIMETINSVVNQTYQNWELLIVDDGSDDNSKELIDQLPDKRIQFIAGKRIGIVGKIKNKGIALAGGDLVGFIDSDDLWASTKLEKQVVVLQQYPEAGFSLTGGYNFRRLHEPIDFFYTQKEGINYSTIFLSIFRSEVAGIMPSLVIRKECLPVTGLFKETGDFSDVDFIVNLAYHYKAVILYEPLVFRRLHDSNHSTVNWEGNYKKGIDMIRSYRGKLPPAVARNAYFKLYIDYGIKSTRYRKWGKAIRQYFKAWTHKPFSIVPLKKSVRTIICSLKGK